VQARVHPCGPSSPSPLIKPLHMPRLEQNPNPARISPACSHCDNGSASSPISFTGNSSPLKKETRGSSSLAIRLLCCTFGRRRPRFEPDVAGEAAGVAGDVAAAIIRKPLDRDGQAIGLVNRYSTAATMRSRMPSPAMPPVVARDLMASPSHQLSANANRVDHRMERFTASFVAPIGQRSARMCYLDVQPKQNK
jgi:hypothetical protein